MSHTIENNPHKEHFITKYIFSMDHEMIAKQFLITGIVMAFLALLMSIFSAISTNIEVVSPIFYPAFTCKFVLSMSGSKLSDEKGWEIGIFSAIIRISVGLEDIADILTKLIWA
jgi:cystathionine beta-lyase/cystathionine gamma-synthase